MVKGLLTAISAHASGNRRPCSQEVTVNTVATANSPTALIHTTRSASEARRK